MKKIRNSIIAIGVSLLTTYMLMVVCTFQNEHSREAGRIMAATGIKGGFVVHLGCGDGKLTATLRTNDSYIVQGLDKSGENVEKARGYIRSLGVYGEVSAERLSDSRLPYIDNLVNLVVAEDLGDLSMDEVMRVLCPKGVAYVRQGTEWQKTVKPRPAWIDEWTHYLHDATGNPVADDSELGPPRHMQWTGGPRWGRHHDHMASLNALVSARGRIFYIFDEGPKLSIQLPPKWILASRDAFNGVILWRRPIETWHSHLWPYQSGLGQLPRRLVADGDRIYVTLGINAPVSELDAATGRTITTYEGTKTAEEIIFSNGILFLLVNPSGEPVNYKQENPVNSVETARVTLQWGWDEKPRFLMAVDPGTGKQIWQQERRIVPLSLASDGEKVVFHDGESLVCLEHGAGRELWRSEPIEREAKIPTNNLPSLRIHEDVILFSGKRRALTAVSSATGELLWTSTLSPSGEACPEDILILEGLVWSGDILHSNSPTPYIKNFSNGTYTGRDLHTGEIIREFPLDSDDFTSTYMISPSATAIVS